MVYTKQIRIVLGRKNNCLHSSLLTSSDTSMDIPIPLKQSHTETIQALKQTLSDLQEQHQALDISICILTQRLNFLLSTANFKNE